jgi:hypothetical protein
VSTSMHRLQISLPRSQLKYLTDRARQEGTSIAGIIRKLISRESRTASKHSADSLWEIIGIGKEKEPLIDNIPVSEQPDLYLSESNASYSKGVKGRGRKGGRKKS